MPSLSFKPSFLWRAALALVALAVLAVVAGSQIAPGVPVGTLLLYCALGGAALLALMLLAAVTLQMVGQWVLRHGGTDTQWLWFRADPPGLQAERRGQARANKP